MLPCNLYHLNGSLKQRATGERLQHKLISTHPNGYTTPQELWESWWLTCLCLRGNFTPTKVKAFGEVAEPAARRSRLCGTEA